MEANVHDLADRILALYHATEAPRRILVGAAGVPGSGKSTLGYPLADRINELLGVHVRPALVDEAEVVAVPGWEAEGVSEDAMQREARKEVALCVGQDGWHYTKRELEEFPDPEEAKRRRGAAFTFDATSYTSFVLSLRSSLPSIPFPTFSHALGDPLPSPFSIAPHQRIIILEGLYTLLDTEPWVQATKEFDERVWVECERSTARDRLVRRHLSSGIEQDVRAARERVDRSDMLNGEWIRQHLVPPTVIIESVDDASFASNT